jgi:hypothetical protein
MTMIESGTRALRAAEAAFLASPATYVRRDGRETRISVVPGRTVFRSVNDVGAWIRIETRDFILQKDALDDPPEVGDSILFLDGEYEVLAPGGEPPWRWSDPYKTAYRIHTKHTGGEE